MKEIEVKILDINVEEVKRKLLDLGAEKVFDGEVHAIAFDFPDKKLHQQGSFVRVRKVGTGVELCFKGKKEESQFKNREEIEVITSSFEETIMIMERIGFEKFSDSKKHRESYKLKNIRFEIDTFPNIPSFLEIEAPTEEEVKEYVEKVGYIMDQTTNLSGYELKEHYQNKNVKTKTT